MNQFWVIFWFVWIIFWSWFRIVWFLKRVQFIQWIGSDSLSDSILLNEKSWFRIVWFSYYSSIHTASQILLYFTSWESLESNHFLTRLHIMRKVDSESNSWNWNIDYAALWFRVWGKFNPLKNPLIMDSLVWAWVCVNINKDFSFIEIILGTEIKKDGRVNRLEPMMLLFVVFI